MYFRPTAPPITREPKPGPAPLGIPFTGEPATEIDCPLTGEVYSLTDVDGLAELYQRLDSKDRQIYAVMCKIRETLASMTEGDAVTRRVRGRERVVKVTMPNVSFDQSMVKECWNSFPHLRDEFLKIDTVGVRMTEFKKLVNTAGSPDLETFRNMLTAACKGRTGLPTIAIEK